MAREKGTTDQLQARFPLARVLTRSISRTMEALWLKRKLTALHYPFCAYRGISR
ncbi:MAG: hypothetical protein JWM54_2277 [Acidobacteriaceae bacterium]|jgi:hypothetical protein|nr:hypothetical protein [Acidobacteriaceae bacterium]